MIPNLFSKQEIPDTIPEELEFKIKEFSKTKNKEEFLKKSFFYITNNWRGSRINAICKFTRAFQKDISKIIKSKGYMHCTTMNFLLRIMAVKSGLFEDNDIKLKLTHSWYIVPHQYLSIKISDKKTIDLDPWYYQFGIDYGKHGSGFDSIKFNPIGYRELRR